RSQVPRSEPADGLRQRAFMTSGHSSFRFVICAFPGWEMPELTRYVTVTAVAFDPKATTERQRLAVAMIANSRRFATLRNKSFFYLTPQASRYERRVARTCHVAYQGPAIPNP